MKDCPMKSARPTDRSMFTMVELITVITIIAILAGIGVGAYGYAMNKSKEARTQALIARLTLALDGLKAKHGYYPPSGKDADGSGGFFYLEINAKKPSGAGADYPLEFAEGKIALPEEVLREYRKLADFENLKKNSVTFNGTDARPILVDGWGQPLYYICPGKVNTAGYDLVSAGADGLVGQTGKPLWTVSGKSYNPNDRATLPTLNSNVQVGTTKQVKFDTRNCDDLGNFVDAWE